MSEEVLIKAENVGKKFCRNLKKSLMYGMQDVGYDLLGKDRSHAGLRKAEFWANEGISFELKRGECLGLIGHNGAGKTTLLKMLNGLIKPDTGTIEMHGRVGALIALGAGFNPILTGRENIYINGSVLGFSREEIDEKMESIIEFSEIGKFIDSPVQNYSSGMQVRLGFSVASQMEPDILLIDEVLAVGDVAFRGKCYQRLSAILDKCCVIFVSHQANQISRLCDRCLYLEKGKIKYSGLTTDALEEYSVDLAENAEKNKNSCIDTTNYAYISDLIINHTSDNEKLEISVEYVYTGEKPIDTFSFHFSRQGEFRAVAKFPKKIINGDKNKDKKSKHKFTIPLNSLSNGGYDLSITGSAEKGKLIYIHKINYKNIVIANKNHEFITHIINGEVEYDSK